LCFAAGEVAVYGGDDSSGSLESEAVEVHGKVRF
jgi:hypothetical protein